MEPEWDLGFLSWFFLMSFSLPDIVEISYISNYLLYGSVESIIA